MVGNKRIRVQNYPVGLIILVVREPVCVVGRPVYVVGFLKEDIAWFYEVLPT